MSLRAETFVLERGCYVYIIKIHHFYERFSSMVAAVVLHLVRVFNSLAEVRNTPFTNIGLNLSEGGTINTKQTCNLGHRSDKLHVGMSLKCAIKLQTLLNFKTSWAGVLLLGVKHFKRKKKKKEK